MIILILSLILSIFNPNISLANTTSLEQNKQIFNDIIWQNDEVFLKYQEYLHYNYWQKITTQKLAGFTPPTILTEQKTASCITDYTQNKQYLTTSGGMCLIGHWLENNQGTKITSKNKLIEYFAPIDNAAEAVSFILNLYSDLKINPKNNIAEGYSLTIKEENNQTAYLIQLVNKNSFGCGLHIETKIIYKVNTNADIKIIAKEQEPTSENLPIYCVD